MKRILSALASGLVLTLLVSCSSGSTENTPTTPTVHFEVPVIPLGGTSTLNLSENPVTLRVVTSYGTGDGNQQYFETAYQAFERNTGHTILDDSSSSSEEWKEKVQSDFATGNSPDVLFFFSGVDADPFISQNQVVSLEEIRSLYPDYGFNMLDHMIPDSTYDGKKYIIPVNGFWEGLFINRIVLEEVGIPIPDKDYTWDQFLVDCEKIKQAGYTPISASLGYEPHYWFEFAVLNNGNLDNHLSIPESARDGTAQKWSKALADIKQLYDAGYFPENTLTAPASETIQLMVDNQAAFLIEGNWKLIWFLENSNPENFTTSYVPAKGERIATEMIGGISMGYYITRDAWEDPHRRDAAVAFVSAMTTSEIVSNFGITNLTAMKNTVIVPSGLSSLEVDSITMKNGATGLSSAVQDRLTLEERGALFAGIPQVMLGETTTTALLQEALQIP